MILRILKYLYGIAFITVYVYFVVDCLIQDSCPDGGDDLRYEGKCSILYLFHEMLMLNNGQFYHINVFYHMAVQIPFVEFSQQLEGS